MKVGQSIQTALKLKALREVDPGQWRDKIVQAFRDTNGNAVKAAEILGVGHRTLTRIMGDDEVISVAVEKIRIRVQVDRKKAAKAKRSAKTDSAEQH